MRNRIRHVLIFITAAALAVGAGGCVIIKSQSAVQVNSIGGVRITTTACASDTDSDNSGYTTPDSVCQGSGSGGNLGNDAVNSTVQLQIAYRIPTGAGAPDSITTTNPGGSNSITFAQDSSYSSALQAGSHAPAGEKWVGYISDPVSYTEAGGQYFTVSPTFSLQQGSDGSPFEGPFSYRVVVGVRQVNGSHPASRPVTCGSPITNITSDVGVCADSPSGAEIATDLQLPTADLGILDAPGTESVNQGDLARIKFQAVYAGDGGSAPTAELHASTDIPGASATPSAPVLTPIEGSNQLRVIVRPPADTPPGHYDVTLTATLPNGETRSSTHDVLVTPTTVRCGDVAPTISGTAGNDVLVGTPGNDVIAGYGGNDRIYGMGGNDLICAGSGNDVVYGGRGNDVLEGRAGNDTLIGGPGADLMIGGPGKDRFRP